MAKRKYEARLINPILNIIKNNLDYLTQPENLPQLAKLGYIYNTLWYAGRLSYGYDGNISPDEQCEENPKYKLEMCDVGTPEQYDWVYDAWGMHVSNDGTNITFEDFEKIIFHNQPEPLTEIEELTLKNPKTMNDWINLLTHSDYAYNSLFPTERSVINYLLCVIGTGHNYEDGHIISTASGARMNEALYGNWENAELNPKFINIVKKVVYDPDVPIVLDEEREMISRYKRKEAEQIANSQYKIEKLVAESHGKEPENTFEEIVEKILDGSFYTELHEKIKKLTKEADEVVEKYHQYYPICNYSNITKFDKDTHPSYIKAAINVCKEILENIEEERDVNIEFAQKFLKKKFVQQYL